MSHNRNKSIFIEKMALEGQHEIRLVPVFLQCFFKICHEVGVDLPSLPGHLCIELASGREGGEEVGQHADPGLGVLQSYRDNILQLCPPLLKISPSDVEE